MYASTAPASAQRQRDEEGASGVAAIVAAVASNVGMRSAQFAKLFKFHKESIDTDLQGFIATLTCETKRENGNHRLRKSEHPRPEL